MGRSPHGDRAGRSRDSHGRNCYRQGGPMAHRELFVNLAVDDVDRSVECVTNLGFPFDERFTDETATCMVIGKDAYAMRLRKPRFADFTTKQICDCTTHIEAMLAVRAETGEAVDHASTQRSPLAGHQQARPSSTGSCTRGAFHDPDGHHWEVLLVGYRGCRTGRRRRSLDKLRCECGHARSHTWRPHSRLAPRPLVSSGRWAERSCSTRLGARSRTSHDPGRPPPSRSARRRR